MKQIVAKSKKSKPVQEKAGRTSQVYGVIMKYTEGGELLIGSGCVALTKKYAKFGVSAHVLPGLEAPDDNKTPLFMIVGANEAGVRKAIDAITPGDAKMYYDSIIKLPV